MYRYAKHLKNVENKQNTGCTCTSNVAIVKSAGTTITLHTTYMLLYLLILYVLLQLMLLLSMLLLLLYIVCSCCLLLLLLLFLLCEIVKQRDKLADIKQQRYYKYACIWYHKILFKNDVTSKTI